MWTSKDPTEILDYGIDWVLRLAGDTIVTSTWVVPAGITKNSDSSTPSTTTIWVSGGTSGQSYPVENRITTAGGRLFVMTSELIVLER